jgi:hypothetical protein
LNLESKHKSEGKELGRHKLGTSGKSPQLRKLIVCDEFTLRIDTASGHYDYITHN